MWTLLLTFAQFTQSAETFATVQLTQDFTLGWSFDGPKLTMETLVNYNQCAYKGWCAIGFGDEMDGTIMFISLLKGDKVDVWAFLGKKHDCERPQIEVNTIISEVTDKTFQARYEIPQDITDSLDLKYQGQYQIIYAFYDGSGYDEHDEYETGVLTLGDPGQDNFSLGSIDYDDDYETHGKYMFWIWLVVCPVMVFLARYLRWISFVLIIHMLGGGTILAFTLYSVIKIFKHNEADYDSLDREERYHSRIGLSVASLVIAEVCLGMGAAAYMFLWKNVYAISVIRKAHKVVGWGLMVAAMMNVWYGWDIYDSDNWQTTVKIVYIIAGSLFGVAELRTLPGILFPSIKIFDCRRRPAQKMTHQQALHAILQNNEKIAIVEDKIINAFLFESMHPGGAFLLRQTRGEDLGKYLIGCSSIGGPYLPYEHSYKAMDYVNHLAIAQIPYPISLLTPSDPQADFSKMRWRLSKRFKIAQSTYMMHLTSPNFRVATSPDIECLGKHFQIKAVSGLSYIHRYYSAIFTNIDEWHSSLQNRGFSIPKEMQGSMLEDANQYDGVPLQLVYKMYPLGKMTRYLYDISPGQELTLKGPLGPGLALTQNYSGKVVGFAAGTGVLPFLDLVYVLYQQEVQERPKQLDIQLTLYVTFSSRKFGIFMSLLEQCHNLISQGSRSFNLIYNYNDETTGVKLDDRDIKQFHVDSAKRIWVCGPSGFNAFVKEMLEESGVERSNILILQSANQLSIQIHKLIVRHAFQLIWGEQSITHLPDLQYVVFSHGPNHQIIFHIPTEVRDPGCVASVYENQFRRPVLGVFRRLFFPNLGEVPQANASIMS